VIDRIEHLAIAAPNWVGDLAMATPVLESALRAPHVGRVSVLVRSHLAPLVAGGPVEPHVRAYGRARGELAVLRELAPDAALLLSNSFGAAWRAFRAGVPLRAGSALSGRRFLLTHAVRPPMREGRRVPIPTAHLLRDVAGLAGVIVDDLHPRLYVADGERARQQAELRGLGLRADEPYVACTPGAAFGAAKLWPPERFARALDLVHERYGWRGVVSGGPGEERLIDAVAGASRSGAISLASRPRSLETLKALVRDARLLVVGDSGPRWVAAAFDVPCVSVMGPNFPEYTATSLELCEVVRVDLDCSPCARRVCPLGHHRCMTEIEPERVVEAARRVLSRAPVSRAA
jgi:heptosyltransferase-2